MDYLKAYRECRKLDSIFEMADAKELRQDEEMTAAKKNSRKGRGNKRCPGALTPQPAN
ncbi:MAG TPA: hypothetical protein VKB84_20615 [Candidatus Binataceae bacterium]|nr:hypothetical protein [Candidatus Binataceae bacterium]